MIKSFSDKETERVFNNVESRKLPVDIQTRAHALLMQLHLAGDLLDLRTPPSNRLHSLSGNLKGFWSLSINKQWRVIFRWEAGEAVSVKITDYH